MQFDDTPRHFLPKRMQEELRRYANNPLRIPKDWDHIQEQIRVQFPYVLHTERSLSQRVFFHCPTNRTDIPYNRCFVKPVA
mgnify:CR=1 FL=1